jgi:hypothetical protein
MYIGRILEEDSPFGVVLNVTTLLQEETFSDNNTNIYQKYTSAVNLMTTDSQLISPTPTPSVTPTVTPTPTLTRTPNPTKSPTKTPTQTPTPTRTLTPTNTSSETQTPTQTPTYTPTNTQTSTPTNTGTPTNTFTPTQSPTNTETPTQTVSVTQTPTNTQTQTQTNTPTNTQTPSSSVTVTPTPTITQTTTPSQTPTSTVLIFTPIFYYDPGDSSSYPGSGTSLFDLSGNSRTATIYGSPTHVSGSGGYFSFSNDYILTTDLSSIITTLDKSHTVEVWIYPTGNGVVASYIGQSAIDSAYHFSAIEIVSGQVEFGLWSQAGDISSTGGTGVLSLNTWHQLVLTYDGSKCRGYIDGQIVGSVSVNYNMPTPESRIAFGAQDSTSQGDGTYFDGRMGIIRTYSDTLTDQQVLDNYNEIYIVYNPPTPTPTNSPTTTSTPTHTQTNTPTNTITPTPTNTITPSPLSINLVLYFDPSNPSSYSGSGGTVSDLSSKANNGTLSNVTYTSPYFSLNGSSSQIAVADNTTLEPGSGSWTMEAWFNITSTDTSGVILGKFDNGGLEKNVSYSIRTSTSANLFAQFSNGSPGSFVNSTGFTFSLNTWYQVVYAWSNTGGSGTIETYINGASIGTVSHSYVSILNSTNPLYIGSYNGGEYSQYTNGKIGTVRIYNTSLNSTQVLDNFNSTKTLYGL